MMLSANKHQVIQLSSHHRNDSQETNKYLPKTIPRMNIHLFVRNRSVHNNKINIEVAPEKVTISRIARYVGLFSTVVTLPADN